MLQAKLD